MTRTIRALLVMMLLVVLRYRCFVFGVATRPLYSRHTGRIDQPIPARLAQEPSTEGGFILGRLLRGPPSPTAVGGQIDLRTPVMSFLFVSCFSYPHITGCFGAMEDVPDQISPDKGRGLAWSTAGQMQSRSPKTGRGACG